MHTLLNPVDQLLSSSDSVNFGKGSFTPVGLHGFEPIWTVLNNYISLPAGHRRASYSLSETSDKHGTRLCLVVNS